MRTTIIAFSMAVAAAGAANAAPVQWTTGAGGNDHWYEFIGSGTTWTGALAAAAGMTHLGVMGHLATVTSQGEQDFLRSITTSAGWLAGSDVATEGTWVWMAGPETGAVLSFTAWAGGEPNNFGNEDYLVNNWAGNNWNDLPDIGGYGYFVEYSGASVSAVPVPAALPLLLSAFGLGAAVARRRRT